MLSWAGPSSRDISYARKQNQRKNIVFFDFTRSVPKFVDPNEVFSNIEQLKNGLLFSAKYESDDLITATPHIVCLSNYLPPNPSLISLDRWTLYRIGNQTKNLIPMDSQQANDFIIDHITFEDNVKQIMDDLTGKNKKKSKNQDNLILQKPHFLTEQEWEDHVIEMQIKLSNQASENVTSFNNSTHYKGLFQSQDQTLVYTPSKQLFLKYGD